MKKSIKFNNKGFVLVETLVVTAFVAAIFSIIFLNIYPLIGEYDKRENYDDVESKYGVFHIKTLIEKNNKIKYADKLGSNDYVILDCGDITGGSSDTHCNATLGHLGNGQVKIILTKKELSNVQQNIKNATNISERFKSYILYLPTYEGVRSDYEYRLIAEFKRKAKDAVGKEYTYYTYSNMEVGKK